MTDKEIELLENLRSSGSIGVPAQAPPEPFLLGPVAMARLRALRGWVDACEVWHRGTDADAKAAIGLCLTNVVDLAVAIRSDIE